MAEAEVRAAERRVPVHVRRVENDRDQPDAVAGGGRDEAGACGTRPAGLYAVRTRVTPEQLVVVLVELRVGGRPPPDASLLRSNDDVEAPIGEGVSREHRKVVHRRVVPLVDEPARRAVARVAQAERPGLVVHEHEEALKRSGCRNGQGHGRVVAGREQQPVVQLPDGYALAGPEPLLGRLYLRRLARHDDHVVRSEVLHCDERGHDLRRRRDRPAHVLPLRPEDLARPRVDDDRGRCLDFRASCLRGAAGDSTGNESRKTGDQEPTPGHGERV